LSATSRLIKFWFAAARTRSAIARWARSAAREIGQVPSAGEAMAALQAVRGVAWVDLVAFGTIGTGTADSPATPDEVAERAKAVLVVEAAAAAGLPPDPEVEPGQLAYLALDAPGTLLLEPATEGDPP
jgi:hypothetical protein